MKIYQKAATICMLFLFYFILMPDSATAQTADIERPSQPVICQVEVNSPDELNQLKNELKASNNRSQMLWEKALAKSNGQYVHVDSAANNSIITPLAYKTIKTTASKMAPCGMRAYLGSYINCNITNGKFTSITNTVLYGMNDTTVSNQDYYYTLIDSNRTCALNASGLCGVQVYGGSYQYYPIQCYIEFYAGTLNGNFYSIDFI